MSNNDESGFALVMALFIAVIVSMMVISMLETVIVDLKVADNLQKELIAYYIAEAGAETAIKQIKDDYNWSDGYTDEDFPGSGGTYSVSISRPDDSTIEVTSVGRFGESSKTVSVTLGVQ